MGEPGRGVLGLGRSWTTGENLGDIGDFLPYVDLGDGAAVEQVALGYQHGCALLGCRSHVKCWGSYGSTGLAKGSIDIGDNPNEMGDRLYPINLAGAPTSYPTSYPTVPPVNPTCTTVSPSRLTVRSISTSRTHTCVLFENFQAKVRENFLILLQF